MSHVIQSAAQGVEKCKHVAIIRIPSVFTVSIHLPYSTSIRLFPQDESTASFCSCGAKRAKRSVFMWGLSLPVENNGGCSSAVPSFICQDAGEDIRTGTCCCCGCSNPKCIRNIFHCVSVFLSLLSNCGISQNIQINVRKEIETLQA